MVRRMAAAVNDGNELAAAYGSHADQDWREALESSPDKSAEGAEKFILQISG